MDKQEDSSPFTVLIQRHEARGIALKNAEDALAEAQREYDLAVLHANRARRDIHQLFETTAPR